MNALPKIAIIGANGFVGSRAVEWFHLSGRATVIPVVRRVNGLASLARFDLDWRIADACHRQELAHALQGCDYVVHAMVGDPPAIEAAARSLLPAATQAGIKRVIYLSTASVHGQNPAPGTDETSPLSDRQELAYNNAKVRAENILFTAARHSTTELIALRPSVVTGPRDRWVSQLVSEILNGTAWLINQGRNVCNTIYVDNLIHAVDRAIAAPATATGRAYLLTDHAPPTWDELTQAIATHLGSAATTPHQIPVPFFPVPHWTDRLDGLRAAPTSQRLIAHAPQRLKAIAKGILKSWRPEVKPTPWQLVPSPVPRPSRERVLLQQCQWQFPIDQAKLHLGYNPPVSFASGLERTIAWLRWCGQLPPLPS